MTGRPSKPRDCRHPILCLDVSPHATQAGFTRPSQRQRMAAATKDGRPGKSWQTLKSKDRFNDEEATFPGPLVLQDHDLATDPNGSPQNVKESAERDERNAIIPQKKTIYVVPSPEITQEMEPMKSWAVPAVSDAGAAPVKVEPPKMDDVQAYLAAVYYGMNVKILDKRFYWRGWEAAGRIRKPRYDGTPLEDAEEERRVGPKTPQNAVFRVRCRPSPDGVSLMQVNLDDVLDVLLESIPNDANAIMMLLEQDIWEGDDNIFTSGRAYGGSRIAVVSGFCDQHSCLPEDDGHAWPRAGFGKTESGPMVASSQRAAEMAPIPITIITGFLGSGKTTLILNLIPQLRAKNPAYKLALLKNEFGDLAVDSQLASSSAISGVQELLNGCICCNLVGQLGPALDELDKTVMPDRIIIETSGSAFPATLALEVNRLARDTGKYTLDGVISVVDVENWRGYEDTSYTAKIQARYTDLIVFNKWEVAGEDRYEDCLDRVGDLDVDVAKVKSTKGWVDMGIVFGVDGGLAKDLTESDVNGEHYHNEHSQNGHSHTNGHSHQQEVEVLSIELNGPGNASASTEKLLAFLKAAPKDEAYRIKALLTLSSTPKNSDVDVPQPAPQPQGRYILNWAFGRWTFTPVAEAQQQHASSNGVVLRMTMILGRSESNRWKKKIEAGGYIELEGTNKGELNVRRIL
ncbi:GTP-binding protein YjiA [Tolypocladium capitatum]|uniref:GTP-binding protein YjiA n=1 Tax=Tolypocladium capitatum TaxID=45235 RepID=A0A2K3QJN4_9HYPO|nr:GTP-binding protein YjiA [Tolypocladium capitatum]